LLGVSAALCAAVIGVSRYLRPVAFTSDAELAALLGERAALVGCDDPILDQLRQQAAALASRNPKPVPLTTVQAKLGPGWHWQVGATGHVRITRVAPRLRDWLVIVASIETLQVQPGLTLTSLDVATSGTRARRTLTRVVLEGTWQP
jgi:hypothetical protein